MPKQKKITKQYVGEIPYVPMLKVIETLQYDKKSYLWDVRLIKWDRVDWMNFFIIKKKQDRTCLECGMVGRHKLGCSNKRKR